MRLTIRARPFTAILPRRANRLNDVEARFAVSALGVPITKPTPDLLMDLQRDLDLTFGFISHNVGGVKYFSDRVAIIYRGMCLGRSACHLDDR